MIVDYETIRKLSQEGEAKLLPVPSPRPPGDRQFKLKDVLECFNGIARLREAVFLVGGTAIRGVGNDVDLVLRTADLGPKFNEALVFRLYRAFSDYFGIPYDDTPLYLHIHVTNEGSYTSFVPLFDLAIVPSADKHVHKMQEPVVRLEEDWLIGGYATMPIIDTHRDLIPLEATKAAWEEYIKLPPAYHVLLYEHHTPIGEVLIDKSYIDDRGLYVVSRIRSDTKLGRSVWEAIKAGELNGYSIRIEIPDEERDIEVREDEAGTYNVIKRYKLVEISIGGLPACDTCRFTPLSEVSLDDRDTCGR